MKFHFSKDFIVDSDKEPWRREGLRIAMLGGPGSGKSWNNALVAEQFLSQGGTVVIFQPRDEYYTLKEKFDVLSVGGVHAKDMEFALTSPSIYAKAVVEDGLSMVFYTSAAEDEEKLVNWVSRFIRYVLKYQERHRRPLLLILEEAQEYCPRSASGRVAPPWVYNRMVKAFKDCSAQGRKLNIINIVSSQRPQELNFTIRQLANLSFYGKFSEQDIGYVDRNCLKYVRNQGVEVDASKLLTLGEGEWLVIMGKDTRFLKVTHPRLTKHGAETPSLEYVAPRTKETKQTIDELAKTIMAAMEKQEKEKSELEKAKRKIRSLEKKLEAAEDKANIKMSVREMLEGGAGSEELAEKLAEADASIKKLRHDKSELKKAYNVTVRELKKASSKRDQLKGELQDFQDFKTAFMKILPQPAPGFEPGSSMSLKGSVSIAEVDERINQRLTGADEIRVVKVDVDERLREIVKNDIVGKIVEKVKALPGPACKAAPWILQHKETSVGELNEYLYDKAGRPSGSFYNNVVIPLEDAELITRDQGDITWALREKLEGKLAGMVSSEELDKTRDYILSFLV